MKEGWMHNLLDTKGRKKSRTASIVFLAIFVATLTLSIILGVVFPRSKRIKEMDDTRFTSVFYAEADEWFYSTEQNIVRLDIDNEITETFSLVEKARQSGLAVTDDCRLVEAAGYPVKLVEGSSSNIKITTPEDIRIAEEWL